jgi:hypothetical protein
LPIKLTATGSASLVLTHDIGSANMDTETFVLTLTGRQDQFSVLSPENNTVFYPSASLSFAFTDIIPENWLTFGKARISYAKWVVEILHYSNNLTYGLRGYDHDGAILGNVNNGSIPNANLQPYISTELEFALIEILAKTVWD